MQGDSGSSGDNGDKTADIGDDTGVDKRESVSNGGELERGEQGDSAPLSSSGGRGGGDGDGGRVEGVKGEGDLEANLAPISLDIFTLNYASS